MIVCVCVLCNAAAAAARERANLDVKCCLYSWQQCDIASLLLVNPHITRLVI